MQVAQTGTSSGQAPQAGGSSWHLWAKGSFSFHDVLDAINPLQHLPVVSTIYREVTGNKIGNAARVAGDALYGGAIGLAVGLVNAMSVSDTGKDLGERAIAMVEGDENKDTKTAAAPQGTVTVEPAPAATTAPASTPAPAARPAEPTVSSNTAPPAKTISVEAALARLPSRPPVNLPFFPGEAASDGKPLDRPQLASLPLTPSASPPSASKLSTLPQGIAIDTSADGILALRAKGHGQAPIPLQTTPGAFLVQSAAGRAGAPAPEQISVSAPKSDNGNDFVIRMRQGIEKYNALLAKQNKTGSAGDMRAPTSLNTALPMTARTTDGAGLLN